MRSKLGIGAGAAAAVLAVGAVAGAAPWKVQSTAKLTDVSAAADPTDGAQAHLTAEEVDGGTRVRLVVTGFPHEEVGRTFGAHVHTGPCVEGNGGAASVHYNHDGVGVPATDENEVWLDLTVQRGGIAETVAEVEFEIPVGAAQSVVIHALPTAPGGGAGARLACLPVDF